MTNTKWLRQALLGGVALGVMMTGAQADELSELKAHFEGLQSRVNQLEQQPSHVALPEGASFITMNRGSAQLPNHGTQAARERFETPSERGFTIAVTPTADLPAPISEVVVYGYVNGDAIYDFDKDLGGSFFVPGLWSSDGSGKAHVRLHARQSRFGILSRTDTAIGQIRTQIEGDFVIGTAADQRRSAFDFYSNDDVGWAVQAGANINLADIATLTVGGLYGQGQHCQFLNQVGSFCGSSIDPTKGTTVGEDLFFFEGTDFFSDEGWGVAGGLSFGLTDTTTFNVQYGISRLENDLSHSDINHVYVQTVHANVMWRPVRQMQLGWEVMWGEYNFSGGDFRAPVLDPQGNEIGRGTAKKSDDALRTQFGAWFFF